MWYLGRDLSAVEMTTELFCGWIRFMLEELELAPATVNILFRTVRAFLRYAFEDKSWISESVHKRFKPVKAPIDNVEAFSPEEVKQLFAAINDESIPASERK